METINLKQNNQTITFKQIDGYDNYFISDNGDVLNNKSGRILKSSISNIGYRQINLNKNNRKKRYYVHRLVAKAFLKDDAERLEVNHIDGNKLNNNVSNLEYVTHSENIKHAIDTGLFKIKGIEHHNAKLSLIGVQFIRDNYKVKYTVKQLAKMFNVSRLTIYKVANYISYID